VLGDHRARAVGIAVVRLRDPLLAARRLAGRDPCDTFDFLMTAAERRGVRCAFYFLAGRTSPAHDGEYSLDDPWIRSLLRRIHARGHEIGLHPSYNTFRDAEATASELRTLERVCAEEGIDEPIVGGRQHYLRWENPTTWEIWDGAGLGYDSTLTFAERPGFRCGVCYEYPAFNLRTRKPLRLVERPLVAMDRTLLDYMGLSERAALEELVELRRRCRLFHGDFTLLWHNSFLLTRRDKRLYREVVEAG
jgi:hypothetical protein